MEKTPTELILYRLDDLSADIAKQGIKVDATHDALTQILAKLNGGVPGTWNACIEHKHRIASLEDKVSKITTRMAYWSGGLGLILIGISLFGDTLTSIVSKLLN